MRAFIVPDFGADGAVGERPIPEPGEGEVRVRVEAAGVNAVDLAVVAGYLKDFMETRLPLVPGLDLAGTIDAIGTGVTDLAVGDDVFGSVTKPYFGDGTFAEYAVSSASMLRLRPVNVDAVTAAALPLSGGTALGLVAAAQLEPGQVVLIMGAGGGIGSYAIALAVHAGAQVIAATRGELAGQVRALGVDYTLGDVVPAVRASHPDGIDAIIDSSSDDATLKRLADALKPGGRLASLSRSLDVEGLAGRGLIGVQASGGVDRIAELADLAAGGLRIPVTTYPLAEAGRALAEQATRQVRGKLVLIVRP
jgi:NADPH:quinone reductase-like Zn-dependent oxidoreductase